MSGTAADQGTILTQPPSTTELKEREPGRNRSRLVVEDAEDVARAANRLAAGAVVAQAFGNFYAITTRPDTDVVRTVNILKGLPLEQVGSVVTTPLRIPDVFDWSRLPTGLTRHDILTVMDACFAAGPFGFRGPAAADVPGHLTHADAGLRTVQVIAPGFACPSNAFLAASLRKVGAGFLYVTSANRSRWLSGAVDEPAHYRADGVAADFGGDPRFVLLEHTDEEAARARYPFHAPMSTTILSFHRTGGVDSRGPDLPRYGPARVPAGRGSPSNPRPPRVRRGPWPWGIGPSASAELRVSAMIALRI